MAKFPGTDVLPLADPVIFVFRVHADDKIVYDSGPVTGRDKPRPVLVSIEDAEHLKLEVDFGEALDVGDQANWANVRLIK